MADSLHLIERFSVFAFLVSSMLGTGLSLTLRAILAPLRDIRFVLVALGLNFVLAPSFAWLLTLIIPLQRGQAIGLLLLGGAAGAPFLPTLAKTARGDLGFSVALMTLLTVGTILFMPFALPVMIPGLQANPWGIARPLLLLILLPLILGMLIAARASRLAGRAAPVVMKVGNAFLLLLFVLLVGLNVHSLLALLGSGAIAAVVFYILALFGAGWILGGAKPEVRGVVGLATAARNFGAALVPAASNFRDPSVTVMLIISAIVCLVISFIAARWLRRRMALAAGRIVCE